MSPATLFVGIYICRDKYLLDAVWLCPFSGSSHFVFVCLSLLSYVFFSFLKHPRDLNTRWTTLARELEKFFFRISKFPRSKRKRKRDRNCYYSIRRGILKFLKKFLIFLNFWLISVIVATGFHHISTGGYLCCCFYYYCPRFGIFHSSLFLLPSYSSSSSSRKKEKHSASPSPLTFLGFLIWRVEKRFFLFYLPFCFSNLKVLPSR